jgi:pyridoxine 4-dehydrogenase
MIGKIDQAGSLTLPGTSMILGRMGYGAMKLAGPGVWGPPQDVNTAGAVLREAVESGVNHIDRHGVSASKTWVQLGSNKISQRVL